MGQGLPDLLGEEGHKGVKELEDMGEDIAQDLLSVDFCLGVLPLKAGFGELDIPVAIVVPDEIVHLLGCHAQLVLVHILRDLGDDRVELGEDPLVLQLQVLGQLTPVDGEIHHQEAGGVPDLIGEVTHGLAPLGIEAHIIPGGVSGDQVEAQRVRAVLLGDHQRIDWTSSAPCRPGPGRG